MAHFDDYHRTVVGYHGTSISSALRIVNRVENFRQSERDYDWLGRGIYFWEYGPKQALNFARIRQRQAINKKHKTSGDLRRATEPLAVVACMIRLGFCLDLTEPENVEYLVAIFDSYRESMELAGAELPKNRHKYRKLDCAIFEYAYKVIEDSESNLTIDTARGIYVPRDGTTRIWPGSWISRDTHIQLCVRNPANLLGTWLHYPTGLGVKNVCEALQAGVADLKSEDSQSESEVEGDESAPEN
ncbi:hypothetical protein KIH39_22005 [Telmatocola sphagniphila]|uniref:Uncharacterized protein n=1 Tax=Telmatocola sphagniphila TaxID=1123043 RepID=A0A8E6EUN3_9BACT|nr:hypothetical protein [Telmatocola sphagniphila]QVL31492.1 hypothetical protein KIH39_22005 [Telmatocola sphagniphila]